MATLGDGLRDDGVDSSLLLTEQGSDPATPASGKRRVYAKADGIYEIDDTGSATGPLGAGSGGSSTYIGARASLSSDQSIPHATDTALAWGTETFDSGGLIDVAGANPSRFTVPSGQGGKYLASCTVQWDSVTGGILLRIYIYVNGSQVGGPGGGRSPSGAGTSIILTDVLDLSAGDYVEFFAFQGSGAALGARATDTFGSVSRLGG